MANTKLELGKEYPAADEHVYVQQMIDDLKHHLEKLYPEGKEMLRHAHPKLHGCVLAEFTILDNIAKDLKVGLFKEHRTFSAYVRFSNGESEINPDSKKDVRGMAIKLLDVPGETLLDDVSSKGVQDFVLIDNETFISRNIKEFSRVIHAVTSGKLSLLGLLLNPGNIATVSRLMKFQKVCRHVLDNKYWSVTPYLLGHDRAIKYHVQPANEGALAGEIDKTDDNYLKRNMVKTLSEQDVYFDFFIQLQEDANIMPVEDPTVGWASPYIKVAKIKIPRQVFDTKERRSMAENFSFAPWHSIKEHRPLGGFNRARKIIYKEMSDFRHQRNATYTAKT